MPTNYSSRFTTIGIVFVLAMLLIFRHPSRLTDPNLTFIQKTELKGGIDMVGGVELIYQIQIPPGMTASSDLATKTMEALKRRVDPNGLRNLVWRPQGANRLEIEMPQSREATEAPQYIKTFQAAQKALEATNISKDDVVNAVEHETGAQRDQSLAVLAMDSKTRADLFKRMEQDYDQIQMLEQNTAKLSMVDLAIKIQPLKAAYEADTDKIEDTNLISANLESILDQANSDDEDQQHQGQSKIDNLKIQFADFPSRLSAIDQMDKSYKDYSKVKSAITGASDLKRLLQGSGVLEFHILADQVTSNAGELQAMLQRMQPGGKGPLPQPGDKIRWMEVDKVDEFDRPGARPETVEWNGKHYIPVLVTPDASMTKANGDWGLENANMVPDPNGGRAIGFKFDALGAKLFGDLTTHWVNYARNLGGDASGARARLAISLDNKVISAPNLNGPIIGGTGEIDAGGQGGFDTDEANYMINTLNAGSLPAQLSSEPISQQDIGPTIGADNLHRGLVACAFGLLVVAVFLIGYYYVAGIVAFFAVCLNVILILGTMSALGATFTLPSIAGIVLTIGTAVDANVLIFERLREEQHKGLPLRMALRNAYNTARSAIIDSNMTSIITSLCLYLFGSEEVKGFGLTLIIGIVASLFTALYVTKTVFALMIDKFGVKNLSSFPLTFPKWDKALRPDWDWMGKAWIFYTFSIIMISIGLVLFVVKVRDGQMMDIEFASGTSVQFQLTHQMVQDDVRKLIDQASEKHPDALPSPSVVAVGNDELHYQVVTPNVNRPAVKQAVLEALQADLKIQPPSTFDQYQADAGTARGKSILPILDSKFSVDGFTPPSAKAHVGGVAIVLRNLNPPLSPDQIYSRLQDERNSASGNESGAGDIAYSVDAPTASDQPAKFVVITASDPEVLFNADEGKWSENLAGPLWKLTSQAVSSPPSFERETNFDRQVAGEMQRDAFFALAFSIIAIMVYIWVRFGNLRYGTATVVALIHDTVFTLAALGFAHYIAAFWPHNVLQIEPFRINLTVVAGVLTIMGYSMIDTIVVFDRIRENRGKYGHLDRKVINDAINQTLSRTILTCGTTIATVSFMYFLGGAGIHGFTFVLLVGILVGTYSSVAIAAPLLLWGGTETQPSRGVSRPPFGRLQRVG
jgi:SecD/SecF fusion protein